jgi:hypothetical protein
MPLYNDAPHILSLRNTYTSQWQSLNYHLELMLLYLVDHMINEY